MTAARAKLHKYRKKHNFDLLHNLKDRATLEITDFEWKLVKFAYCLQVSGDPHLDLLVLSTAFVADFFTSPRRKFPLRISSRRPKEKISFKISLRRPTEKISLIACKHQMLIITNLYRTPYVTSPRGSGCTSDATHTLIWVI